MAEDEDVIDIRGLLLTLWRGKWTEFKTAAGVWRCTDLGTRTIIAIKLSEHDDTSWFNGPPYVGPETVFDEYDLPACAPLTITESVVRELVDRQPSK